MKRMNQKKTRKYKRNTSKIYKSGKKNITVKRNKSHKTKLFSKKYFIGSGEREKKETLSRDNFRNMFMKALERLIKADKTGNQNEINSAINLFKNGFKSNQLGINSLIPVTNNYIPINKYKYSTDSNPIIGIVPCVSVMIMNLQNSTMTLKVIIKSFIENKGNINLQSIKGNITALSTAIDIKNKELVQYLLENGADIKLLEDEKYEQMKELIKEEIIEQIVEPPLINITKLTLPSELPNDGSNYDPNVEPTFWKPLFKENEILALREKVTNLMKIDSGIPIVNRELDGMWNICQINKAIIPTYYVPTKNDPYELFGTFINDKDIDFSHYNIILCAALLIFGVISEKMIGQDYKLIFKGGKAIQLVLAGIPNMEQYVSEDIDVLVLPNENIPYNEANIKNLAGHVSYLIKWFLNMPDNNYNISVKEPVAGNPMANPFIFKLSFIKTTKKYDYRRNAMIDDFRQFSDIDFKETPESIKPYFEKSIEYKFYIEELGENILFRCPNIGALLDEKIYYYIKYSKFYDILNSKNKITEEGYERLNLFECKRILDKFKRAILAMNRGLQKQRFPGVLPDDLISKEKASIMMRLNRFGVTDDTIKNNILISLYSN